MKSGSDVVAEAASGASRAPHLSVFVDADTLQAAADHVKQTSENPRYVREPMPPVEPAALAGHGAIGPNLLM